MVTKTEVLLWPMRFGLQQTRHLGGMSIEATKALARRQVEFGQGILHFLDPKEFVMYRKREMTSEESRRAEIQKLGKDLQDHDVTHPGYPRLVQFSAQSMLKLINQWAADGSPISKDGREQAEKFLRDNKVPDEIIFASLDQLQIEKPVPPLDRGAPDEIAEVEIYSPS